MADTCTCPTADNYACFAFPANGIGVFQPTCGLIPNGDRVENPYLDVDNNVSYYTYGVTFSCVTQDGETIQEVFISVCENISIEDILVVEERLDGCPDFTAVSFDLNNTSGQTPPPGYRYLRILVSGDVTRGSAALYRITLSGIFPAEVLADTASNTFIVTTESILAGFLAGPTVPYRLAGCPAEPRLTVTKTCDRMIVDNRATLSYQVVVSNTGNADLADVQYSDIINYNGPNVALGMITVNLETIRVDTTTPGVVRLSGNLGTISAGGAVTITYTVPIMAFSTAGSYEFNNTATASSGDVEGSATCNVAVDVVALFTYACCRVMGSDVTFEIAITNRPNSPVTLIDTQALLTVPNGVVVQFESFGGCQAFFADTMEMVPLNSDVTGRQINIVCDYMLPSNVTITRAVDMSLKSTTNFSSTPIEVTDVLQTVDLQQPDDQILLDVDPLPNSTQVLIDGFLQCPTTIMERR